MKFAGNMLLTGMIILEVTENQGFTLSLEDTFLEKTTGGRVSNRPPPAFLGLKT